MTATFITPPDDEETLKNFVKKVNPGGPGWKRFQKASHTHWSFPNGIVAMILGCIAVYSFLLGVGQIIYGQTVLGFALVLIGFVAGLRLKKRFSI